MITPLMLGSLFSKSINRILVDYLGYRRFLIINSILVGLCIASFALIAIDTPVWLKSIHFFLFGILNSLQFVTMNAMTLAGLNAEQTSNGNSFLSMIMMVSMSLGIALASSLLNIFTDYFTVQHIVLAFHATLVCLGAINLITAVIFSKLP